MYVSSAKSGGSETPLLLFHGIPMITLVFASVKAETDVCDLHFRKQFSFYSSREVGWFWQSLQLGILLWKQSCQLLLLVKILWGTSLCIRVVAACELLQGTDSDKQTFFFKKKKANQLHCSLPGKLSVINRGTTEAVTDTCEEMFLVTLIYSSRTEEKVWRWSSSVSDPALSHMQNVWKYYQLGGWHLLLHWRPVKGWVSLWTELGITSLSYQLWRRDDTAWKR